MRGFIVGDKVIKEDGVQGFVTEITEHDEVVVESPKNCLTDLGIYDKSDKVLDVYDSSNDGFKQIHFPDTQRPQVGDFTRYGIVNRVEFLTHGVLECSFIVGHIRESHIWIDTDVDTESMPFIHDGCNYWVNGKDLHNVLEYFELEFRADEICVPKRLQRFLIPHTCMLQVELPDGNIREWSATIGEDTPFTVEAEADSTYIATSIADLKKLGIERINLISTYAVEGFEQIK